MKMAGIIGGMGPSTTAEFYGQVNKIAEDTSMTERPELMLWNIPLNYALENRLLTTQEGLEEYLPILITGAKKLEKAGSDFLVMPCNTVHGLYDQVTPEISIPFLHIVDQTVKHLQSRGITKAALFATEETISSGMYQGFLERAGIAYIVPDETPQKRINEMVSELVTNEGAELHRNGGGHSVWFTELVSTAANKVGSAILGCTDLQIALLRKEGINPNIVDSMQVLAQSTIDHIYC